MLDAFSIVRLIGRMSVDDGITYGNSANHSVEHGGHDRGGAEAEGPALAVAQVGDERRDEQHGGDRRARDHDRHEAVAPSPNGDADRPHQERRGHDDREQTRRAARAGARRRAPGRRS